MAVTNGYATGADAQALLNQLGGATLTLSGSTVPTLTQVEGWLDGIAAEVDAALKSAGYGTVPATGTNDKLLLGRFVAMEGAYMAYGAGFMFDQTPDKVANWHTDYRDFIKRLLEGQYTLPDQSYTGRVGVVKLMRYIED